MKRIHLHLALKQIHALHKLSEESGLPAAEIVRRALDAYLEKLEKMKED